MEILDLSQIGQMLKPTEFTDEEIGQYKQEGQFMKIAVDLLIEIGEITTMLCTVYPLDEKQKPRKCNRNEAILCGLLTRTRRMQIEILDANQRGNLEATQIFFRCLSEGVINLMYLLQHNSGDLFNRFVIYSLRSEKELLDLINKNIEERNDKQSPIEERMKRSIFRSFEISKVNPEDIDAEERRTDWMKNSLYERAKSVGLAEQYIAAFALPCHEVHGNWQDLIRYHLKHEDDGFTPEMHDRPSTPQIIIASALFSSHACGEYLATMLPECPEKEELGNRIDSLVEKCLRLDAAHENFVQSTGNVGR